MSNLNQCNHYKKFWSQPLRVECAEKIQHITTRTAGSRLWFVNNRRLEDRIQGFLGYYLEKYKVDLFAFKLMGNHFHLVARFPLKNRAPFMRDFNARIAEAVRIMVPSYDHTGSLWQRRYSCQALVTDEVVAQKFIYSVLQPITSGLTPQIHWYGTECFLESAALGQAKTFKFLDYRAFNAAFRRGQTAKKRDFYRHYKVHYQRLPGYEQYTQKEYYKILKNLVEKKRQELVRGHTGSWMSRKQLKKIKAGSRPTRSKISERQPLALGACKVALREWFEWYFSKVQQFRESSLKFRQGFREVVFPESTYHPPSVPIPA